MIPKYILHAASHEPNKPACFPVAHTAVPADTTNYIIPHALALENDPIQRVVNCVCLSTVPCNYLVSYESSKFAKFHAEQRGVFFRSFCESFTSEEDDDETHVCFRYLLKVYPLVVFVSASVVLMHLTPSYEGIIRMILVCYLLKLNTSQGRILHPIFF